MPGTKRASTGGETPSSISKKAKTENGASKRTKKSSPKPSILPETFKSSALPLHFNISHTPPSTECEEGAPGTKDEGWLGHVSALPTTFSTGSLGWKGSKRLTVELEVGEEGKKERVQVMLNINATVLGTKPSKNKGGQDDDNGEEDEEEEALKAAGEEAVEENTSE